MPGKWFRGAEYQPLANRELVADAGCVDDRVVGVTPHPEYPKILDPHMGTGLCVRGDALGELQQELAGRLFRNAMLLRQGGGEGLQGGYAYHLNLLCPSRLIAGREGRKAG